MGIRYKKLSLGERALLKIIFLEANRLGYCSIPEAVRPTVEALPRELVFLIKDRARLTQRGEHVIDTVEWL